MTSSDLALVVQSVAPVVREFYASQIENLKSALEVERKTFGDLLASLELRLAAAEQRALIPGPAGADGRNGLDGANGQDGAPGRDGKDGINGIDGKDGSPGLNGKDGADGLHGKDGAAGLNGKDGADGLHGKDGAAGLNGKDGADGLAGKDGAAGIGIADLLVNQTGELVVTLTDGRVKSVGRVVGADGAPGQPGLNGRDGMPGVPGSRGEKGADGRDGTDGKHGLAGMNGKDGLNGQDGKDGQDGLGFDDVDLVFDEARGFLLKFSRGTRSKEFAVPVPHHTGIWEPGRTYPKGAMVTVRGGSFVALRETTARPDEDEASSRDWKLAAKRGRDGKPGKDGKSGDD